MNRDKTLLLEFLKNKIEKIENEELSPSEFVNLKNYFLESIIKDATFDELKHYLFVGYVVTANNK